MKCQKLIIQLLLLFPKEPRFQTFLLDTNNNVIKGFSKDDCNEIIGDEISKTVTWSSNSSLFLLKGEKVKFYMKDADVYSLSY